MALAVGIGMAKAACVLVPAWMAWGLGSLSYSLLSGSDNGDPVQCEDSEEDRPRKEALIQLTQKLAQQMGIVNPKTTQLIFTEKKQTPIGSNLFPNSRKIVFFPNSDVKNPELMDLAFALYKELFLIKNNAYLWLSVVPVISSIFAFTLAFYLAPLAAFPLIPLTYFITLLGTICLGSSYAAKKAELFLADLNKNFFDDECFKAWQQSPDPA